MGKIWVEVCLISARSLRRPPSLFKPQWYAVGWIDPNNKYCTRIDTSGNSNPTWKTKFSTLIDGSDSKFKDLAVQIEVYSREPIFLRERLQGSATVVLKEFIDKYVKDGEGMAAPVEEVGSFQLRKRKSGKMDGFVDVSIRVSEEREDAISSYIGDEEGFKLEDPTNGMNFPNTNRPDQTYQHQFPQAIIRRPENNPPASSSYSHPAHPPVVRPSYQPPPPLPLPLPPPNNHAPAGFPYSHNSIAGPIYHPAAGVGYQPQRNPTPPPPPPPSNVGYIPTFIPTGPARNGGPGFGVGVGAGALAAGAVIFGDDFMSGFDIPAGLQDPSITISTDSPF